MATTREVVPVGPESGKTRSKVSGGTLSMRLLTRGLRVWLTSGLQPVGHRDEAWLKSGDCPARSSTAHLAVPMATNSQRRSSAVEQVIIGVDPHKLSATVEVIDHQEPVRGSGRFTTDQAGYAAMRNYAKAWSDRVWAVEGANGTGRPLAQRLLEAGEQVVDVPAKLAARVRLFDTGHNRKTDALDAHSIAVVAMRTGNLRVLRID